MIISAKKLMELEEFKGMDESLLQEKLEGIENLIRSYTNNKFQNVMIRFEAESSGGVLLGASPFLRVGDTIEVSQSKVNDGLYVISELSEGAIKVVPGEALFDISSNLVTKVEYPKTVIQGVVNMMKWEVAGRDKVGIKSETISRHSVTYYDQDANNQVMGYPVSLLGFLEPYMRARF